MIDLLALLAIEIGMDPEIADFGGLLLTWHGVFTAVGIAVAVAVAVVLARRLGFIDDDVYSVALIAIPSGIVGARALFVIERWSDPGVQSFMDIIRIDEGGISIYGAVLGGIIGGVIYGWLRKLPILRGLDVAACAALVGMAVGRIGDVINGEHFAKPSDLPWSVLYTHINSPSYSYPIGVNPERIPEGCEINIATAAATCAQHPAVAYEAIGDLLIFGLLVGAIFILRKDGIAFFGFLLLYSLMRFGVSELRLDSREIIAGLTTPQVVALFMIPIGLAGLLYVLRQPERILPGERAPPDVGAARSART